ncbi:hypothetical protein LMH87_005395 [Akanthomyces muscarius]|uniref:Uncharacterized protein n=1 Tax=Akanthomyces muscarius TaxID=2231603 RepID=A0A9W8QNP6_AKAMU|nr:hypothetical protein LMH87_005395 [Akanthomyces muscarius]KAJ4163684.1 hypothetical protein LMH87_005395 [Akanthomyces muscarius]
MDRYRINVRVPILTVGGKKLALGDRSLFSKSDHFARSLGRMSSKSMCLSIDCINKVKRSDARYPETRMELARKATCSNNADGI